ncbi:MULTISPECIES: methyl-accepting chemotaxis protein [unclassified Pseudomonas]|uniref:methyl-accepting chemotaxis protein n=1 Tax=unclassified Pseudomonas TaxID=196821 RepID=UPI00295857EE|nr:MULTISPECIES: methyl-accepting chemotaxis protein [unclassified Pseudomonas]
MSIRTKRVLAAVTLALMAVAVFGALSTDVRFARWGFTVLAIGLLVMSWEVNRYLTKLLAVCEHAVAVAQTMGDGDFRPEPVAANHGAEWRLVSLLQDVQVNWRARCMQRCEQDQTLQVSARSLNDQVLSIADSTGAQATGAVTMAQALDSLGTAISLVAGQANNAKSLSNQSEQLAYNGSEVIANVIAGVEGIVQAVNQSSNRIVALGHSSEEVHSIIQVIRGIAEQTNLLALNAAIEAARAGSAGRGFAVVADEVRNLAARTAQSTQEVTDMIDRIRTHTTQVVDSMQAAVTRANEGVALAKEAGLAMDHIREGAHRSAILVEEISQELGNQTQAAGEIASRVEMMARKSRSNNLSIQSLAQASQQLEVDISSVN